MKRLNDDIANFLHNQGYVIVTTIDKDGFPSSACKGIVQIDRRGRVYLLDLYRAKTRENLETNPHISLTAVDEHRFMGYSLKGKARIVTREEIKPKLIKEWEDRITSRLTRRLLRNLRAEKGHHGHPEALLPEPEYMIAVDVEEIVNLAPHPLK